MYMKHNAKIPATELDMKPNPPPSFDPSQASTARIPPPVSVTPNHHAIPIMTATIPPLARSSTIPSLSKNMISDLISNPHPDSKIAKVRQIREPILLTFEDALFCDLSTNGLLSPVNPQWDTM